MLFWISWRTTRVIVFTFLLALSVTCWDILRHAPMPLGILATGIDGWHDFALLWIGLGFAACILGSKEVDRDGVNGRGAQMLAHPQAIGSSIWVYNMVVLAEIVVLSCITMTIFTIMYRLRFVYFGLGLTRTGLAPDYIPLQASTVVLVALSMVLFAALLFSMTRLMTSLTGRAGTGLALTLIVFVSYILVQHGTQFLPGPFRLTLPNWQLNPFDILSTTNHVGFRLAFAILARAFIVVAILCAAKVKLKRSASFQESGRVALSE